MHFKNTCKFKEKLYKKPQKVPTNVLQINHCSFNFLQNAVRHHMRMIGQTSYAYDMEKKRIKQ